MLSIHLNQLLFFCHHGYYTEEKKVGGEFLVDVQLEIAEPARTIRHLHESINYVQVYDLVKKRMMVPTPLLETLVMEMADELLASSPLARKVSIHLQKMSPPIIGFQGQVGVSFSKTKA